MLILSFYNYVTASHIDLYIAFKILIVAKQLHVNKKNYSVNIVKFSNYEQTLMQSAIISCNILLKKSCEYAWTCCCGFVWERCYLTEEIKFACTLSYVKGFLHYYVKKAQMGGLHAILLCHQICVAWLTIILV